MDQGWFKPPGFCWRGHAQGELFHLAQAMARAAGKDHVMQRTSLSFSHFMIALAVTLIWGTNFVVMRYGLDVLPPLLFAALRFAFVFLPVAFFLPKPDVSWGRLASYGLLVGALQFGVLLVAMREDVSPGLASLLVQAQVFFTIGLAIFLNGERVLRHQWFAVVLAISGIVLIGVKSGGDATAFGILLALISAFSWAAGNMVARATPGVNMLAYVVWSGVFAAVPLFIASWIFEGREAIVSGLSAAGPLTWLAVLWQAVANSLFGYAAYGWLLARYQAASVAPLTLLVPVFGLTSSALLLGEGLPAWKITAAVMIIGGLVINQFWPVLRGKFATASA